MCRPYGWVLGQNTLNRGPFFDRVSLNIGGFSRNWQKLSKMGSFSSKFIIKVGMTAIAGNYTRIAF